MRRVTVPVEDGVNAATTAFYDRLRPLVETYARDGRVQRVAVVGNQPLPPSAERAEVIDAADLVFRVNGFRTDVEGEPPSVGRRTDIVVFNRGVRPTPWFFQGYTERLYLMIEPGRLLWENPKLPEFWPKDLGMITMPNREVILPLGEAMGADPRDSGQWATTGTVMLWMATRLFPEAAFDVAGLSFVHDATQTSWNHAYGDPSAVGAEHRISLESELVRRWIDDGLVSYHP
ncbi:Contig_38, whole genome shotgun sequence [Microbacterium sp. 8M]|uniref:glycosyltransferase family 29 protein n=1 Tax=Microbacterium sp. 8M TaxID=2653153 RepID=UPI0012F4498E|nr:glycosyltransferase family 29 protein [Microbacterium sp. 8M]VXB12597.1 Contig_38, whole genome shotgun sequence [Microbacterium sp. 8M]